MTLLAKLSARSQQAEVLRLHSESTSVHFEANAVKSAGNKETQGTALRAVVDGHLGFTAASGRAQESELIDRVIASARYGEPVPIEFPGPEPGLDLDTFDAKLNQASVESFVDMGKEIVALLTESDADAKVNINIERGYHRWTIENSAGTAVENETTSFSLSVDVERVRSDDVLLVYDSICSTSLPDDWLAPAHRLVSQIERAKRAAPLESGRMPVLFAPKGALVLLLPILLATNGENVLRGTSPLSKRAGETVFDPQLSVWDDPTIANRPASASYDDEGVPCYRKALIESGVLKGFIHDLKTGALTDTASTGNGSRSLFSPPSPAHTNLVVSPGQQQLAKMISGLDHALLVEGVLGLGQGNAISGAFSNTLGLAFAIENGEIVGRVKNVSIAGNIYEDLCQIDQVSQERTWVYGRYLLPHLLLPELNVVVQK